MQKSVVHKVHFILNLEYTYSTNSIIQILSKIRMQIILSSQFYLFITKCNQTLKRSDSFKAFCFEKPQVTFLLASQLFDCLFINN